MTGTRYHISESDTKTDAATMCKLMGVPTVLSPDEGESWCLQRLYFDRAVPQPQALRSMPSIDAGSLFQDSIDQHDDPAIGRAAPPECAKLSKINLNSIATFFPSTGCNQASPSPMDRRVTQLATPAEYNTW